MVRAVDTLTPEERAQVIERSLEVFANRWIERLARAAPDLDLAARVIRERLMSGGSYSPVARLTWEGNGVQVLFLATGHRGIVRYREIAAAARRTQPAPVQLAMSL